MPHDFTAREIKQLAAIDPVALAMMLVECTVTVDVRDLFGVRTLTAASTRPKGRARASNRFGRCRHRPEHKHALRAR
jgi:hypothetical protein